MRKRLYIVKRLWKSMGVQFALVAVVVFIASLCIHYACVLPAEKLTYYARYGKLGMSNSANLSFGSALMFKCGTSRDIDEIPGYSDMTDTIGGFADIASFTSKTFLLGEGSRLSLYIYNNVFVNNVDLPNGVSRALINSRGKYDGARILIDDRLKSTYAIGDIVPSFKSKGDTNPYIKAYVVGYVNNDDDFFYSTSGGSVPSITHLISSDDRGYYVAVTEYDPILGENPSDYTATELLLFPKDGARIDDVIDTWRAEFKRLGYGTVMSFREMEFEDLTIYFIGEANILGLMSLWSLLILLVGLRGFIANLADKVSQQVVAYRLNGMTRGSWYISLLLAYGIPIIFTIAIPQVYIIYLFIDTFDFSCLPIYLSIGLVLEIALILPMVTATSRGLKKSRIYLMYLERGL